MNLKLVKLASYFLVVFFLLPLCINAQGWERIFPAMYESLGRQVFIENDSTYSINTFTDGMNRWMQLNDQGYELSAVAYPYLPNPTFIIRASDGHFVSASNGPAPLSYINKVYLTKRDMMGNLIWEHIIGADSVHQRVGRVVQDNNGDYIYAGMTTEDEPGALKQGYVSKADESGNLLWTTLLSNSHDVLQCLDMVTTTDEGVMVIGSGSSNGLLVLAKLDGNGNELWSSNQYLGLIVDDMITTADGNIALIGRDNGLAKLIKLDEDGNEIWTREFPSLGWVSKLIQTTDQGLAILNTKITFDGRHIVTITKTDVDGYELWEQSFLANPFLNWGQDFQQTSDGGYIIVGATGADESEHVDDLYIIKTDANGNSYTSNIDGFSQYDLNEDCLLDNTEQALEGWIVAAAKANETRYGLIDETGHFQINADTGTYTVNVIPPSEYWFSCDNIPPVQLAQIGDSVSVDIPVQSIEQCPLLEIQTSSTTYRICDNSSTYQVYYCNQGTEAVDDITIEITFDDLLTVESASAPIISQSGNTYIFDGGSLDFLECSFFSVDLSVACDVDLIGQTLCTEAHIYPDSSCLPIDPLWSGASITANAYCDGDSVRLELENIGTGDMQAPLNYIVVEDDVIMISEPYQLDIGEILPLAFPADGDFYRIESPQEPYHPGNSMPSAHVEACVSSIGQEISLGFVNQYPLDDNDYFIDIHCKEIVGSYDPNIKEASPRGYQEDHFIEPNTPIDYTIHFQNTGTDTAFKVVIQDILSPLLNPATFRKGAASHPYEVELTSEGVLIFTFDNIMLPDSNINEPASHGFVQFSIGQQTDLVPGTVINNEAGIYFDFNPPIITNQTYHTIEEDFIAVFVDEILLPEVTVKVYPNPFFNSTTFEVDGIDSSPLQFNLFDATGKPLRSEMFTGLQFNLHRDGLPGGIYFYTIQREGKNINTGKIIAY